MPPAYQQSPREAAELWAIGDKVESSEWVPPPGDMVLGGTAKPRPVMPCWVGSSSAQDCSGNVECEGDRSPIQHGMFPTISVSQGIRQPQQY